MKKRVLIIMSILSLILGVFSSCKNNDQIQPPTTSTKVGAFNLVSPSNNETSGSQIEFAWTAAQNATAYKFQISQSGGFSTLDFEKRVTGTSYKLETILDGNRVYYWRVVAVGSTESRTKVAANAPYVLTTKYRYLSIGATFRDNMVIQRNSVINIFGYAKKNIDVSVDFNNQIKNIISDENGYYCASYEPMSASSEAKTITVTSAGESLVISNVVIGDVFLCSGQSNIQVALSTVDYTENDLNLKNKNSLRLFSQLDNPQETEQKQVKGGYWFIPDGTTELNYSALAYLMGYMLEEYNSNIPVGVIFAAKGDTHIQQWMSYDAFSQNFTSVNNGYSGNVYYNGMLAPLANNSITAMLWYQGENNAWDSSTYKKYLLDFAADMRLKFYNQNLPIFVVQLPKYNTNILENMWANFRLVQAEAAKEDSNIHLLVTYDGGDITNIHPTQKRYIAERFLLSYRKYVLNEDILADSPSIKSVAINGAEMILSIQNAEGLYSTSSVITGFEIAGANNAYKEATAQILSDGTIKVYNSLITAPLYVRYCYKNAPEVTIFNSAKLPLAPFWNK